MICKILDNYKNFITLQDKNIDKTYILDKIAILEKNLLKITTNFKDRYIYIDIKDRFLFIVLFFCLAKLESKVVLLPIEIKNEDYYFSEIFYISDNKKSDFGLYLTNKFEIECGNNFKANNSEDTKTIDTSDAFLYLYTSGSTGKAKLIPKSFNNIFTELKELQKIFNAGEDDVFYFTPPLYHIYGILFGFFLPLYCNSKLILDYHFTPDSISGFVKESAITFFVSTPPYYGMFVDLGLVADFNGVAKMSSSSAPLPLEVSKEFYKNGNNIREVYGSTETGGIAHRVSAKSLEWQLFSYVKIVKNEDTIENNDNKIYKELIIESEAISNVYDKRLGYNTGDIVEFIGEDKFALAGRNTRFVKIAGKRVDLKYVEKKFIEYISLTFAKNIKESEIFVGEYNEKIYIFFEVELTSDINQIKLGLKEHLPGYAIPRYYFCQKIPRNEMGKINKIKIEEIVKNHH